MVEPLIEKDKMEDLNWTPASKDSASFNTVDIDIESNRFVVSENSGSFLFSFFFILLGFFGSLAAAGVINVEIDGPSFVAPIFIVVGVYLLLRNFRKLVVDKDRGEIRESSLRSIYKMKSVCRIADVVAIQLLSKEVEGSDSYYLSYEVNLVLNGGARVTAWVSGKLEIVKANAESFAYFLNVPLLESKNDA